MASSRGTRKAGTHRMDGAMAALTPFGFTKKVIRNTISGLLKVYGDNDAGWYFVEEDYYKLVIDKIIEDQNGDNEENDAEMDEHDAKMGEDEAIAQSEAVTVESCGQPLLKLEGGSSSNRELSKMVEFSPERAIIKMEAEESWDMVPGINPSSKPKREPCYGWISEDED